MNTLDIFDPNTQHLHSIYCTLKTIQSSWLDR